VGVKNEGTGDVFETAKARRREEDEEKQKKLLLLPAFPSRC
jgi:hypothetical protein